MDCSLTFVAMPFLKMPAALRLLFAVVVLLLLMMSVYRGMLLLLFSVETTPKALLFFTGMLVDAGVAAAAGLLFLALSFYKWFHPYRSKTGFYFFLGYFTVVLLVILLVYAVDLVFIKTTGGRLWGSGLAALFTNSKFSHAFLANIPVLALSVGCVLGCWVFWKVLDRLHILLGVLEREQKKMARIGWYVGTVLFFSVCIGYSLHFTQRYTNPEKLNTGNYFNQAITTNPVVNIMMLKGTSKNP